MAAAAAATSVPTFKLVLCGEGSVGKTTFVKRHLTGEYTKQYIATVGAEVHKINFSTSRGPLTFAVWDTAGQERYRGLRDGYFVRAHCGIIMFDVQQRISYKNVPKWYKDLTRTAEGIPIVLVGNKADVKDRAVRMKNINFHRRVGIPYYDISAKSNYNVVKPFLKLAQMLTRDDKLTFTATPALQPPEITMSDEQKHALEAQRAAADAAALPDDDDF